MSTVTTRSRSTTGAPFTRLGALEREMLGDVGVGQAVEAPEGYVGGLADLDLRRAP